MKDFTIIIVCIAMCVTILTYKALDEGHNGVLLDGVFTFFGGLIGAVSYHYAQKLRAKERTNGP